MPFFNLYQPEVGYSVDTSYLAPFVVLLSDGTAWFEVFEVEPDRSGIWMPPSAWEDFFAGDLPPPTVTVSTTLAKLFAQTYDFENNVKMMNLSTSVCIDHKTATRNCRVGQADIDKHFDWHLPFRDPNNNKILGGRMIAKTTATCVDIP